MQGLTIVMVPLKNYVLVFHSTAATTYGLVKKETHSVLALNCNLHLPNVPFNNQEHFITALLSKALDKDTLHQFIKLPIR